MSQVAQVETLPAEEAGFESPPPAPVIATPQYDPRARLHELALEQTMGTGGLFSFGINPDDKQVTKEIAQFYQGGLGLLEFFNFVFRQRARPVDFDPALSGRGLKNARRIKPFQRKLTDAFDPRPVKHAFLVRL